MVFQAPPFPSLLFFFCSQPCPALPLPSLPSLPACAIVGGLRVPEPVLLPNCTVSQSVPACSHSQSIAFQEAPAAEPNQLVDTQNRMVTVPDKSLLTLFMCVFLFTVAY